MPVEVAAVLEDLAAQGAAVNPFVLPRFVPLRDNRAVRRRAKQAPAVCRRRLSGPGR